MELQFPFDVARESGLSTFFQKSRNQTNSAREILRPVTSSLLTSWKIQKRILAKCFQLRLSGSRHEPSGRTEPLIADHAVSSAGLLVFKAKNAQDPEASGS